MVLHNLVNCSTVWIRLEEIIPKILPIILFILDLPIIPKTATYYSQCDHLNTENTTALKDSAISTS